MGLEIWSSKKTQPYEATQLNNVSCPHELHTIRQLMNPRYFMLTKSNYAYQAVMRWLWNDDKYLIQTAIRLKKLYRQLSLDHTCYCETSAPLQIFASNPKARQKFGVSPASNQMLAHSLTGNFAPHTWTVVEKTQRAVRIVEHQGVVWTPVEIWCHCNVEVSNYIIIIY